jgi:hypothetical protein
VLVLRCSSRPEFHHFLFISEPTILTLHGKPMATVPACFASREASSTVSECQFVARRGRGYKGTFTSRESFGSNLNLHRVLPTSNDMSKDKKKPSAKQEETLLQESPALYSKFNCIHWRLGCPYKVCLATFISLKWRDSL